MSEQSPVMVPNWHPGNEQRSFYMPSSPHEEQIMYARWGGDNEAQMVLVVERRPGLSSNFSSVPKLQFERFEQILTLHDIGLAPITEAVGIGIEVIPSTVRQGGTTYALCLPRARDFCQKANAIQYANVSQGRMRFGLPSKQRFGAEEFFPAIKKGTMLVAEGGSEFHDIFDHALVALCMTGEVVSTSADHAGRVIDGTGYNPRLGAEHIRIKHFMWLYEQVMHAANFVQLFNGTEEQRSRQVDLWSIYLDKDKVTTEQMLAEIPTQLAKANLLNVVV